MTADEAKRLIVDHARLVLAGLSPADRAEVSRAVSFEIMRGGRSPSGTFQALVPDTEPAPKPVR
jgi:hypothetical protein